MRFPFYVLALAAFATAAEAVPGGSSSTLLPPHINGQEQDSRPLHLTCADWRKGPDGSWSPVRPTKIDTNTFRKAAFSIGSFTYRGRDVASELNRQCL
jgi:hypothetical protein